MEIITEGLVSYHLVASICSIVEFKMMKLVEAVKFFSWYRKNWVIWELVFPKMLGLIFLILLRSIDLSSE